ncbi:MAG: amidoligase family protein [Balneolaceae bacterium]
MKFITPPHLTNQWGEERKIGVEFEFTGLEMEDTAKMLTQLYGGEIEQVSTYEFNIEGSEFGTFKLELDASILLHKKYETVLESVGVDINTFKNKTAIENTLRNLASTVVPFEIITPPIPFSELNKVGRLVDRLRIWKAKGTGSSVFYAFGMHLNPEVPSLSAESLLRHLKAYVLLDPWIRKDAKIDLSRKITPYINEYDVEYLHLILREDYAPDLENLIRDYFKYKNSRNRSLDMIPVFMHLNKELVQDLSKDELSSSRPTFHYRLPNCSIEDESWSVAKEWNRWVLVEKLAEDQKTLQQYSKAFLKWEKDAVFSVKKKWVKLMDRWVQDVQ